MKKSKPHIGPKTTTTQDNKPKIYAQFNLYDHLYYQGVKVLSWPVNLDVKQTLLWEVPPVSSAFRGLNSAVP